MENAGLDLMSMVEAWYPRMVWYGSWAYELCLYIVMKELIEWRRKGIMRAIITNHDDNGMRME